MDVADGTDGDVEAAKELVYGVERYAGRIAHEDFGGVWLEGGTVVAAFTAQTAEHEDALRGLLAEPERLAVVEVEHPVHVLEATAGRVGAVPDDALGGAEVRDWAIDPRRNRVTVSTAGLDDRARAALAERLGADRICVSAADGP